MTIGPYEIRGDLGQGSMGKVMLGWDPKLECLVAIKSVRVEGVGDKERHELESRLLREARAAAQLNHPGIVKIKHMLDVDDCGYIVMEFVKGETLDKIAPKNHVVDPAFALRVLRDCASALDHAHARNIVHRDIKPSNIMIEEETGNALITDFGIAKVVNSENHTDPGMVLGTLDYMAPEQLLTGTVDGRADQFALAVVAYRMLTGARLYNADTLRRLSFQITSMPPASVLTLNPALPPAIDAVFSRALAKEPEGRFPTCQEFVSALEAALAGSPMPAGMVGPDGTVSSMAPGAGYLTSATAYAAPPAVSQPSPASQPAPAAAPPSPTRPPAKRKMPVVPIAIGAVVILGAIVAAIVFSSAPKPAPIPISAGPAPASTGPNIDLRTGEMVLVDGGNAMIGEKAKPVNVPAFYIDKTEVTNAAYLAFCHATLRPLPPGIDKAPPEDPVVNVSFNDAQAFAAWAGKRLPTAEEWEKAARGPNGQSFPWGNDWKDDAANLPKDEAAKQRATLSAANSFPSGESPYHVLNMIGNVWEWTATPDLPDDREFSLLKRSSMFKDMQPPLSAGEAMYEVRGGSYKYSLHQELPAGSPARVNPPSLVWDWMVVPARFLRDDIGFRCVRNP